MYLVDREGVMVSLWILKARGSNKLYPRIHLRRTIRDNLMRKVVGKIHRRNDYNDYNDYNVSLDVSLD